MEAVCGDRISCFLSLVQTNGAGGTRQGKNRLNTPGGRERPPLHNGGAMHKVTEGLVLREADSKEHDKILTVLTKNEGKLTVIARGARRKNSLLAGAAQLLVYSEMTLFEYKGWNTMDQAETIELFDPVRSDVELLSLGSYFAELTEQLTDEDCATPEILSLILNSLYALGRLRKPPALVKAAFELRLMTLAGYEPLADGCAICGREEPEAPCLNLTEGVLHCAACGDELGGGRSEPLCAASLAAMRRVVYGDPRRLFSFSLEGDALGRFAAACESFVTVQLDRGFGTLDFYKKLTSSEKRYE